MKAPQTLPLLAFVLALATVAVAATAVEEAPVQASAVTEAAAADPACPYPHGCDEPCPFPPGCNAPAVAAPLPWAEAAVIPAPASGDCAETQLSAGFQVLRCGGCSPSPCANAQLNSACGVGGGGLILRCVDDGLDCSDTKPVCNCRSGPL